MSGSKGQRNETAYKLVLKLNEIQPDQWDKFDERDYTLIDAALRRAKVEAKEYAWDEAAMRAACAAHRACCGVEADNAQGKIHGCCVICGVPWPCETAQFFLFKADAQRALDAEREKVKELEKMYRFSVDERNKLNADMNNLELAMDDKDSQITTLQVQLRQVEGELANEKTAYKKLSEQWNKDNVDLSTFREVENDMKDE